MDWVLQKATELGVAAIAPLRTQWTEVRLTAERAERRHQHWHGVIAAACEQCGRAVLPALTETSEQVGRAHVCTPVTHAQPVCRLLLAIKTPHLTNTYTN